MWKTLELFGRHASLKWFALVTILATVIGFCLDFEGFSVNVLASFFGTFIGIAVSITIIEKLLDEQNAQVWKNSRQALLQGIVIQLSSAVREYLALLPNIGAYRTLIETENKISQEKILLIRKLHTELSSKDADELRDKYLLLFDTLSSIFSNVDSLRMSYVVIPGADNDVVTRLTHINTKFAAWEKTINRNNRNQIISTAIAEQSHIVLSAVADTLEYCISTNDLIN